MSTNPQQPQFFYSVGQPFPPTFDVLPGATAGPRQVQQQGLEPGSVFANPARLFELQTDWLGRHYAPAGSVLVAAPAPLPTKAPEDDRRGAGLYVLRLAVGYVAGYLLPLPGGWLRLYTNAVHLNLPRAMEFEAHTVRECWKGSSFAYIPAELD